MDGKILTVSMVAFFFVLISGQACAGDINAPAENQGAVNFPFYVVTKDNNPGDTLRISKGGIPIPPKRPDIMKASPDFIREFEQKSNHFPDTVASQSEEIPSLLPMPPELVEKEDLDDGMPLEALDENPMMRIPVPPPLPESRRIADAENVVESPEAQDDDLARQLMRPGRLEILKAIDPQAIEPSSGLDGGNAASTADSVANNNATIISFALEPEQIELDDSIETFLRDHALRMFRINQNLRMEIQSYATPAPDETHSNVRISLARALEIRRFLIDNGISPTRLKLKPMTQDDAGAGDDRIDLVLLKE